MKAKSRSVFIRFISTPVGAGREVYLATGCGFREDHELFSQLLLPIRESEKGIYVWSAHSGQGRCPQWAEGDSQTDIALWGCWGAGGSTYRLVKWRELAIYLPGARATPGQAVVGLGPGAVLLHSGRGSETTRPSYPSQSP